ncbi:MAG: hypothetical protein K0Q89_2037 [Thermomicrobiales bacterium]|nr:hypothetical protein [Thermomicrobiales bacterium]
MRKARICVPVGKASWAPERVTASAPAALPSGRASSRSRPRANSLARTPANASPAPIVSTTGTGQAGRWCVPRSCHDHARHAEPPPESFTGLHRRGNVGDRHPAQPFGLDAVDEQHVHGRPQSVGDRLGTGGSGGGVEDHATSQRSSESSSVGGDPDRDLALEEEHRRLRERVSGGVGRSCRLPCVPTRRGVDRRRHRGRRDRRGRSGRH